MTESLKVNPMVIIGKSKVKACKTLPYTTLSLFPPLSPFLSLHSPAILITTYHYVANQKETGAECITRNISTTVGFSLHGLKGRDTHAPPFILNHVKDSSVIKQYPLIAMPLHNLNFILIPLPLPINSIHLL